MTETNDSQSQSRASRSCVPALVVMATIAGLLAVGIQYLREQQRLSFERQKAERRQRSFDRVKNGDDRASIVDSKLLPMLANDAACVSNLNELDFDMTAITHEDARYVSRLRNVRTLYFYDTRGADLVLENARDLPIVKMGFEMARLNQDSLRSLSDFPILTEVHFEHVMFPNEIAVLEGLPPRITVRIPHPAKNEPGFKGRGEPPKSR